MFVLSFLSECLFFCLIIALFLINCFKFPFVFCVLTFCSTRKLINLVLHSTTVRRGKKVTRHSTGTSSFAKTIYLRGEACLRKKTKAIFWKDLKTLTMSVSKLLLTVRENGQAEYFCYFMQALFSLTFLLSPSLSHKCKQTFSPLSVQMSVKFKRGKQWKINSV